MEQNAIQVLKIKSKTPQGKWFTCEIEETTVIKGEIYFLPRNKKYQYLKLNASNCIITKYNIISNFLNSRDYIVTKQPCAITSICLQVGMKVLIKNDIKNFMFDAGKVKTITKQLPDFGKLKAFALDNDEGIWCIVDFEKCVNFPDAIMS